MQEKNSMKKHMCLSAFAIAVLAANSFGQIQMATARPRPSKISMNEISPLIADAVISTTDEKG
jgi:hypothetical protein